MKRNRLLGFAGILLAIIVLVVIGNQLMKSESDGIEIGKTYPLAATYKVSINGAGEGRVFDFADRNLPCPSILTMTRDERGLQVVVFDPSLSPSTLRKVSGHVDGREIEGVKYPAYDYIEWRYNAAIVEVQSVIPKVTARNGRC